MFENVLFALVQMDQCVLTLEFLARSADAGDYVRHMTQDSGEQQKAEKQLHDDEHILELAARTRQVPDGG
jgi:hypothetical protein